MKAGDRVIVVGERCTFYGKQVYLVELRGESAAQIAYNGKRLEVPLTWLAPLPSVGGSAPKNQNGAVRELGAALPSDPVEAVCELGAALPNNAPILETTAPPIGGSAPKTMGAALPKAEEPDLISALTTLRDRLQKQGTLPGWIEKRTIGEHLYYRYRWRDNGQQQRAIAPADLPGYQDKVRRGQICSHIEALLRLLEDEF